MTISRDCLLPSLVAHDAVCDHLHLEGLFSRDLIQMESKSVYTISHPDDSLHLIEKNSILEKNTVDRAFYRNFQLIKTVINVNTV